MQERQGADPFAVASAELGLVALGLFVSVMAYRVHVTAYCTGASPWTTWVIVLLTPTALLAAGLLAWLAATALRMRRATWLAIGGVALAAAVALGTPVGGSTIRGLLAPAFGAACGPYAQYVAYFAALAVVGIACWAKALREAA
jgi:hypothetical protein